MTRSKLLPHRLAALIVMSGMLPLPRPGRGSGPIRQPNVGGESTFRRRRGQVVALGVGKTVVVDLPRDIRDVLVADPKIANAVVRTSRRAYLIGVAVGQTNVYFFDATAHSSSASISRSPATSMAFARP